MKYLIPVFTLLMTALASCSGTGAEIQPVHDEHNAAYYWKTVFHLDSADLAFLKKQDIKRVYLRMFDVTKDAYATDINEKTIPNASVKIGDSDYSLLTDSLADMEFVPVVYITLDALKTMAGHEGVLASNIVNRIANMCSYNCLPNVQELQLDCDWTTSTEASFFALCDSVRNCISRRQLPWRISSTIRLHQLQRKAPPVDNGVLMVYNTGNFNDPNAENSIISVKDVKPYLKYLSDYPLHLDVAYPTYSWQLLFRKNQFMGLFNGADLADTTRFAHRGENTYAAVCDIPHNNRIIRNGDIIREETSGYADISAVKALIEAELSGRTHSNILYHIDYKNLSKYTSDEIDNLFSTGR